MADRYTASSCQPHWVTSGRSQSTHTQRHPVSHTGSHQDVHKARIHSVILSATLGHIRTFTKHAYTASSCQPHWVTSGRSQSTHTQRHPVSHTGSHQDVHKARIHSVILSATLGHIRTFTKHAMTLCMRAL